MNKKRPIMNKKGPVDKPKYKSINLDKVKDESKSKAND
jgi:hypothetical protein